MTWLSFAYSSLPRCTRDDCRQALSSGFHLLAAKPSKAKNKTGASRLRREHGRHSTYRDALPGGALDNLPVLQPVCKPEYEVHPLIAGLDPREISGEQNFDRIDEIARDDQITQSEGRKQNLAERTKIDHAVRSQSLKGRKRIALVT